MNEIVLLKQSEIEPYEENPRNNDGAVEAVAKSIARFGFNNPVVVDKNGVLIAGHTRFLAAKSLGIEEIPAIVTDMSDELAREYRIIDNKSHEFSQWAINDLIAELRETREMDDYFTNFDVSGMLKGSDGSAEVEYASQSEIEERKLKMESSFKDRSDKEMEKYFEVVCPECGEVFYTDKGKL